MLHRTNKEIDKKGNVIGGELKEKCDKFISCLDKFEKQYLSDKFNSGTISGKDQQETIDDVQKWLTDAKRKYESELKYREEYIDELRAKERDLKEFYNYSRAQKLDNDTVESLMAILNADFARKLEWVTKKNREIDEYNNKLRIKYEDDLQRYKIALEQYRIDMDNYESEMEEFEINLLMQPLNNQWQYRLIYEPEEPSGPPKPPNPPKYKSHVEVPLGPSVPQTLNDELFDKILDILKFHTRQRPGNLSLDNKTRCERFITPLLQKALRYCNDLIGDSDLSSPKKVKDWFLGKAYKELSQNKSKERDKNMYRYICAICTFDAKGFPGTTEKIGDIYWTCLCIDLVSAFQDCMKDFKPDKKGSSSTKKWIEKVCKQLRKAIKSDGYSKFLKDEMDNLYKALSVKAPSTISKRPTIKQKPVKTKISNLTEHIKKAIQKVQKLST